MTRDHLTAERGEVKTISAAGRGGSRRYNRADLLRFAGILG